MPEYQGRRLRQKLNAGEKVLGAWISSSDPIMNTLMIDAGFDFLLIDMEHAAINIESLQQIMLFFRNQPTCPLVRVPWHERSWVKWALDCGAEGILFPNVTTAAEARQAVALCKYPPDGIRGYFPRAASNFLKNTADYLSDVNQRIHVWIQIEDIQAIDRLDDIFDVPGIDGVLIGPADLSLSMGILGQVEQPQFKQALQRIILAGKQHHIPIGYPADDSAANALKAFRAGCQMATIASDWQLLAQAADKRLLDVRQGLSNPAGE
jgi:2-keto-3-deoxy-L-rhamnonate aldolase RhmA